MNKKELKNKYGEAKVLTINDKFTLLQLQDKISPFGIESFNKTETYTIKLKNGISIAYEMKNGQYSKIVLQGREIPIKNVENVLKKA